MSLEAFKKIEEQAQDLATSLEELEMTHDLQDVLSSEAWHISRQLQELIEEKENE